MNRRSFIKSTALALPSVAVLGAISTQPTKTYKSLFTREQLSDWCEKRGEYYYDRRYEIGSGHTESAIFSLENKNNHNHNYLLDKWLSLNKTWYPRNKGYKVVLKDVVTFSYKNKDVIVIEYDIYS